jgi:hypothetical protein
VAAMDGWIGLADRADVAEWTPSVVVSAAHSALGAVRRLQVRLGEVAVLLSPAPAGWRRDAVAERLDVGAHLAAQLDLAGRDEPEPAGWAGTLPISRYAAFRTADPDQADALAWTAGCPPELVRALAEPVALSRVEVVRRDGAALPTGPTRVVTDELAWVDGGTDGLWTVRPDGPDEVAIGSGTPAGVAAALAGMVRAARGC